MRFLFLLTALSLPISSYADSVNVQLFKSPYNLNYGIIESGIHDNAPWDEKAWEPKYFLSADYHYVKDPLVVINTTTNTRVRTLVTNVHTADLALGYFFSAKTSIYAQLPVHMSNVPGSNSQFDLGDSRLSLKQALTDIGERTVFSIMPELYVPTGNAGRFLSDDGVGVGALLIADREFDGFRMAANLGFRYSSKAAITGIDYKYRIPIALGAAIPIAKKWLLNLEASGALALPTSQRQNASEFYLGTSYHPYKYLAAILGASLGAFDGAGSSKYRLQAAVRMYFGQPKKQAPQPRYEEPVIEAAPPPRPARRARIVEDKSRIEILEEIQFEHDSDRLKRSSKEVLDEVAEIIHEHKSDIARIHVDGHTSLVGPEPYNMKLSWKRAWAVVNYLAKVRKVPAKLLVAHGYGETRPKYLEGKASAAELELNRRVEFNLDLKKP